MSTATSATPRHLPADLRSTWQRLESPTSTTGEHFDPDAVAHLPAPVTRWLRHAIAPGTVLRRGARLTMRGEIEVGRWIPFRAEQVLSPDGFIWAAKAARLLTRIQGFDRYSDGSGEMRWKLAMLVPVMTSADDDTTRSAAGRFAAEALTLVPAGALGENVQWHPIDDERAAADVTTGPFTHRVTVCVREDGSLRSVSLPRWGNPDKEVHAEHVFGVKFDGEQRCNGYLLPAALHAGWWFGTDRWDEGEFFRATIEHATLY